MAAWSGVIHLLAFCKIFFSKFSILKRKGLYLNPDINAKWHSIQAWWNIRRQKKKKAIPVSEMLSEAWLILPAPDTCKIQREEAEELDSRNVRSFLSLNRKW